MPPRATDQLTQDCAFCAMHNMESLVTQIPGRHRIGDFITPPQEADLIQRIDQNPDLAERPPAYLGPLPDWLSSLAT